MDEFSILPSIKMHFVFSKKDWLRMERYLPGDACLEKQEAEQTYNDYLVPQILNSNFDGSVDMLIAIDDSIIEKNPFPDEAAIEMAGNCACSAVLYLRNVLRQMPFIQNSLDNVIDVYHTTIDKMLEAAYDAIDKRRTELQEKAKEAKRGTRRKRSAKGKADAEDTAVDDKPAAVAEESEMEAPRVPSSKVAEALEATGFEVEAENLAEGIDSYVMFPQGVDISQPLPGEDVDGDTPKINF